MALQEELELQGNWLFKYRGILPLLILLPGFYLYIDSQLHPAAWIKDRTNEYAFEMICLSVSLVGLLIRVFTVGYTQANTSGRNTEGQVADSLNTTGLYSIMRHPLYVGNFFMWLGIALLTLNFWFIMAFILVYWLYYERIMFAEEQYLRKKFGPVYLQWSSKTPAVIPMFSRYQKPETSLSWRKILRNEKNGLAALFSIYFLFDFFGEYVNHSTQYNYFLLFSCIISLISYVILKYLKSHTRVLVEEGR